MIVIGGGYWGTATAIKAQELGWSVRVIDDYDSEGGSRNASGICDPKVYFTSMFERLWPPEWPRSRLQESIQWLESRGAYWVEEMFCNRFLGTLPRPGAKALYLPYADYLLDQAPNVETGTIYNAELTWPEGVSLNEGKLNAKRLAICAGFKSDQILDMLGLPLLGVGKLWGRGLNVRGVPNQKIPVSMMIKPYVKHTVRPWGGGLIKVGDTAEVKPNDKKLENLRAIAREVVPGYTSERVTAGYRPVMDRYTVYKVPDLPVVVATGGHRLGLGVAGLVADYVLEALK